MSNEEYCHTIEAMLRCSGNVTWLFVGTHVM